MTYFIELNCIPIGYSELENADAPMGVVFGKLELKNIESGFDFFKQYCIANSIEFEEDINDKFIQTSNIPNLRVLNNKGKEIIGTGNSVSGIDSDSFEITVIGIPYPFYEEEFSKI